MTQPAQAGLAFCFTLYLIHVRERGSIRASLRKSALIDQGLAPLGLSPVFTR